MRVAVDAINLVDDRRGMGRYARAILDDFASCNDLEITLLVRNPTHVAELAEQFPFAVRTLAQERQLRFDAAWYPWNGVRFDTGSSKVVTIHDAFAFTAARAEPIARWREQRPIRRAFKDAAEFATVSSWSAAQLAAVSGIAVERFSIVPPVPHAFWKPVTPSRKRPYVLFVAGPDERKNAAFLFAAFERAFPDGDVTLIVAGSLRERDEAVLRESNIVHERIVPDDETLRELYASAYALAVPSTAEGYGLMAVEAMACGAAVVAADAAALPETCDGAAMLVAPDDLDGWSAALRRVVEDDGLRAQLAENSLARAARVDRRAPARATLELLKRASANAP